MSTQLNPEMAEKIKKFFYEVALVYANHYETPSLYECTTKLKLAKNIIIPDGASLGHIVLTKGLEYMFKYTELVSLHPVRYAIVLNDNIMALKEALKLPDLSPDMGYAVAVYTENDNMFVEITDLDDDARNRIIDSICYRPSPFG